MAAFSEEIVEIKCDPHKILNNTYLYRFFCSKFKSFHTVHCTTFEKTKFTAVFFLAIVRPTSQTFF